MLSCGQKCSATSRAIVHSAVVERYVERVLARVERLRIGDPLSPETDIGPVVSEAQLKKIEDYFGVAATEGHERAVGGAPISPRPDDGYFVGPTVYLNVPRDSRIGQEEIFGPVLAVMEAESREAALEIANCSEYGLSASIYTHDLGAALQLSREIKAGVVHVNSETTGAEPHVPFGGMKNSSSHSREQGKAAREFYTDSKTVYVTVP